MPIFSFGDKPFLEMFGVEVGVAAISGPAARMDDVDSVPSLEVMVELGPFATTVGLGLVVLVNAGLDAVDALVWLADAVKPNMSVLFHLPHKSCGLTRLCCEW